MDRRHFTTRLAPALALLAAAPAVGWHGGARAQGGTGGPGYASADAPVTPAPGKRIDVVDFFWYECPHCYRFEPALEAWIPKLAADTSFRRVPVGFSQRAIVSQFLYYALDSLGLATQLHRPVFDAIHRDGRRLLTEAEQLAFVAAHGVDGAAYSAALRAPAVRERVITARQLADAYRLDGVPAIGVHGRFYTAPALAGSEAQALAVADALIARVRREG